MTSVCPSLPLELTDTIIDNLGDDRRTLKAFALAGSTLSGRARRNLHRTVRISSDRLSEIQRLEDVYESFKDYIKDLTIAYGAENLEMIMSAKRIINNLRHLEEVKIEDTMYDAQAFEDLFVSQGQNIHTLRISKVSFNGFDSFVSLVSQFRRLRYLRMDVTDVYEDTDAPDDDAADQLPETMTTRTLSLAPPPSLRSLYTGGCTFIHELLTWLCHSPEVNVQDVQVAFPMNTDGMPLFNFMQHISQSLTHLDLDLYAMADNLVDADNDWREADVTFGMPLLSDMPNLQSLTFGSLPLDPTLIDEFESSFTTIFSSYSKCDTTCDVNFLWIPKVLQDIGAPRLRQIQFNCTIWQPECVDLFPFHSVNSVLTRIMDNRLLPCLKTVTFLISVPTAASLSVIFNGQYLYDFMVIATRNICGNLPTLVNNGLLRIVECEESTLGEWRQYGSSWDGSDQNLEEATHVDVQAAKPLELSLDDSEDEEAMRNFIQGLLQA
ncbi:unnamed protein product [Somion occarium]|uniref:F-box domain-containing protein n=1 Tax=Somion occarium TaxID=3059160 RepID=A0ABP1ECZ5_9APHY